MPELNLTPIGFYYNHVGGPDRNVKGGIKEVTSKLDDVEENRMSQIDAGRLGEIDREIEHCTRAITFNPNVAEAYNNRGMAFYSKEEYDLARKDFGKVIELKPGCLANLILKSGIKLPEDIAAVLTPEETGVGRQKAQHTAHPVEPDVEIGIKKIKIRYNRAWKTLATV